MERKTAWTRAAHVRSGWLLLVVACLGAIWGVPSSASAQPGAPPLAVSARVRGASEAADRLIARGRVQSPTFARLLAALDEHHVLVYVTTGFLRAPGRLDVAGRRGGTAMLRIAINVPDAEARLIAALAHELQHAIEVAEAPEVTDNMSLARFYESRGHRTRPGVYCTREAQQVTRAVLFELGSVHGAAR